MNFSLAICPATTHSDTLRTGLYSQQCSSASLSCTISSVDLKPRSDKCMLAIATLALQIQRGSLLCRILIRNGGDRQVTLGEPGEEASVLSKLVCWNVCALCEMIRRAVDLRMNTGKVRGSHVGFIQKVKPTAHTRQTCLNKDNHDSDASNQNTHLCWALCPVKRNI
mmetsp:Transcript_10963/g.67820  ORF Transcript_10963/g.67820 Transcript_10963/m.67820 type:complete len:167 (-) Transcript_10963:2446-2946(-)